MNHLVWTRSKQFWQKDKVILRQAGVKVSYLPCVSHQEFPRKESVIKQLSSLSPEKSVFIWTSALAVNAFLDYYQDFDLSSYQNYCLSKKTQSLFLKRGLYCRVFPGVKTALDLGKKLLAVYSRSKTFVLPGGTLRAFDLASFFDTHGSSFCQFDLYKTKSCYPSYQELDNINRKNSVVCFASLSAVRGFVGAISDYGLQSPPFSFKVAAMGPTTAKEVAKSTPFENEYPSTSS